MKPGEYKTVQARILAYADAIGWTFVSREEAESARDGLGITVSYWSDLEAIRAWKEHTEHRLAQARGRDWYAAFRVRVCRVEREYGF